MSRHISRLRKLVPDALYRQMLYAEELYTLSYDKRRFKKTYAKHGRNANVSQIDARLIFHAHAIEKGLSHENMRYGFGKKALKGLAEAMREHKKNRPDKPTEAYINAISVIRSYVDVHGSTGHDISHLDDILGPILDEVKGCKSDIGGAKNVTKSRTDSKDFKDLFNNRHSVRAFSSAPIDQSKVVEAINISTKAPSICNRQSSRVRVLSDKKKIEDVLRLHGGLSGYETPPMLITVTTDNSSLVELFERNQGYVDGGLFAMSLLLALEYEGLATCSLNAMFRYRIEKRIRRLLDIRESENIVMFIAVGNPKEKVSVPKSFRYNATDITVPVQ